MDAQQGGPLFFNPFIFRLFQGPIALYLQAAWLYIAFLLFGETFKYKQYIDTPKHEPDPLPTDEQRKKLCEMAAWAFIEIRALGNAGKSKQASDLADTFHNVLREQYGWGHWTWDSFRSGLEMYQAQYYRERTFAQRDYTKWLDEIKNLCSPHFKSLAH